VARGRKNEFGSSWWAQKWNNALESYGWSNRLQRGRSYARSGHVLDVNLKPGLVEALVEGTRPRPYSVKIKIDILSDLEWETVIEKMAQKAIFSAKLLAGEMPENIEEAFALAGVRLFPENARRIHTSCSCPDYANPCKHIAAVYYILGQEFDRDPFMIFRLRGMDKDDLMNRLRKARGEDRNINGNQEAVEQMPKRPEELVEEIKRFRAEGLDVTVVDMSFSFTEPKVPYSIIRRLGTPSIFKEKEAFEELMALRYDKVGRRIKELLDQRGE
jgi:uncharacterized Zn finger protein